MIFKKLLYKINTLLDKKFNEDIFFRIKQSNNKNSITFDKNENYWIAVAQEILKSANINNGKKFFQNKAVLDHLSSDYADLGYEILRKIKNHPFGDEILNICQTPPWGSPFLLRKFPSLSSTTATHLANILSINDAFDMKIEEYKSFVDFGGGYGGLARCILQLNTNIDLSIIDFKQMTDLQQLYLKKTLRTKLPINFYTNIDQLNKKYEIFNACFSFSETPLVLRETIEYKIFNNFEKLHIIFQERFNDIDNLKYMEAFSNKLRNKGWQVSLDQYKWYRSKSKYLLFASKN